MIVCEGVFSMTFFWPRNTIMFVEGPAVHATEVLRQTAREFQSLHWGRVAFNAASAAFIFVGFLKFYRAQVIAAVQHPRCDLELRRTAIAEREDVGPIGGPAVLSGL